MDDIVKMAPELRTQSMQFNQAIIRRFGSIMPANRAAWRLQIEVWQNMTSQSLIAAEHFHATSL